MSSRWSDDLRRRMEMHQETPPENLWDGIEEFMQKSTFIKPILKPGKSLLWSRNALAVAGVAIIVLTIGFFILDDKKEIVQIATEVTMKAPVDGAEKINKNRTDDRTVETFKPFISKKSDTKKRVSTNKISSFCNITPVENSLESIEKEEEEFAQKAREVVESTPKKEREENKHPNRRKRQYVAIKSESGLFKGGKNNKSTKWAASICASNISSSSINRYNGYRTFSGVDIFSESSEEATASIAENAYKEIIANNRYKKVYTDVKHRQPIVIGVSANYFIDKKWSIRSGGIYTILISELRSGSESYYYNSKQALHNIGIPLNINYNCWENEKLSIYLSSGGLVEKNISGRLTTDYLAENKLKSTRKEKLSIDKLQWSLNISAGLQYNLSKKVGLYVEPGVSYHLKNRSEVETIYKDKPLNISLRLGLTFNIGRK